MPWASMRWPAWLSTRARWRRSQGPESKSYRQIFGMKDERCRAGPLRVGRSLRDAYTGFALGLPSVRRKHLRKRPTGAPPRREHTRHEVTAPRVVGPAILSIGLVIPAHAFGQSIVPLARLHLRILAAADIQRAEGPVDFQVRRRIAGQVLGAQLVLNLIECIL